MSQSTNKPINLAIKFWLRSGLLAIVFVFSYYETILSLVKTWLSRDDYSHGFLIPFISLYLVYEHRDKLKHLLVRPNMFTGLILTLTGSLVLLAGRIGGVIMVQQISLLIMIVGLVVILLGKNYLKALSLPLAYLIFMVPPILDIFIGNLHWPLQLFSAKMASILLNLFNIPVFLNAQYLELPNSTLEVADICSGVNYLVSIAAIGIPLAYLTQKNLLRRVMLVIFAIIVGILTNPLRVAFIGILAFNGSENLHGPSHIFRGLFVSIVGFVFLFIGAWIFAKIPLRNIKNSPGKEENKIVDQNQINDKKKFNLAWFTSIVVLSCLASYLYLYNPKPIPINTPLTEIPLTIGNWECKDADHHEEPFGIQGADDELTRVYRNTSGREIKLYVGYFESQRQDKELIHYKLQKLYEKSEEIKIPITSYRYIRVNKTLIKGKNEKSVVLYCYDLNGRIIANNYKAKFITALDGLIHRKTNGAIILVSSNMNHPDAMQKVLNDEAVFVKEILPILDKYLP